MRSRIEFWTRRAWPRKTCFQHWLLSVKMATPGSGVGRGEGCLEVIFLVNSKGRELQICAWETKCPLKSFQAKSLGIVALGFQFNHPYIIV